MSRNQPDRNERQPSDEFHTTHWSIVVSARKNSENDLETRRASLEELCSAYWMPLFSYLRRKGISPDDSADFVQGFFSELIEKDFVKAVDQERGRFRWFLMSAINRYIAKQIEKNETIKRGGQVNLLSIDWHNAERDYCNEPVDGWTAEKIFDRRWALSVLKQTLESLDQYYHELGQSKLFEKLRPLLMADGGQTDTYKKIAVELEMTEGAVKVAASRMRDRYKSRLSQIVSQTLADPAAIDDEIRILLNALRGPMADKT